MKHTDMEFTELMSLFNTLTPEEAAKVIQFIETLKEQRQPDFV